MGSNKTSAGNFFEDFSVGQVIAHAVPRTVTDGDRALYTALYGTRCAVQSSDAFARAIGFERSPLDDMLVFHVVFGKTVPDISLNAVANLGYAECRFLKPVFPGDTLSSSSEVIGLKENSNGKTGVVYVRSTGINQHGETVLEFVRWVMVRKRDEASPAPEPVVPELAKAVDAGQIGSAVPEIAPANWDVALSGQPHMWGDYEVGEKIDHVDGMTVEEAEHMIATRLYQNTAKVHFNQFTEGQGRFRPAADLWRARDLDCTVLELQRAGQCVSSGRDQRRRARGTTVCRRYGVCVVGSNGQGRTARAF
jgi:2-methylfumaryl-CoA hydratase